VAGTGRTLAKLIAVVALAGGLLAIPLAVVVARVDSATKPSARIIAEIDKSGCGDLRAMLLGLESDEDSNSGWNTQAMARRIMDRAESLDCRPPLHSRLAS
jgi:hypothetical protein